MKILVLGHGGHGKDTFAKLLADYLRLTFVSSSEFAMDKAVWPYLEPFYRSKEDCFRTRSQHRDLWRILISSYNSPDKTRLCRELLQAHDIYVGLRSLDEYNAVKHLFTFIFWVDASQRLPLEPSMEIPFDAHMKLVDNNGSPADLGMKALYAMYRIKAYMKC